MAVSTDDTSNSCYLDSLALETGAVIEAPDRHMLTATGGDTDVTGPVTNGFGYSSTGDVVISITAG